MTRKKFFGTDGIRGVPGTFPLDSAALEEIGFHAAKRFKKRGKKAGARILIGRDTRESGTWMERLLMGGVARGGGEAFSGGVLSTPAVAWLTAHEGFDAGVVVSASHNPWNENGVKFFSRDGFKISDADELYLEKGIRGQGLGISERNEDLDSSLANPYPLNPKPYSADGFSSTEERLAHYLDHLASLVSLPEGHGTGLVLDCANGAVSRVAPAFFERMGFRVTALSASPDGRNINENCGALHPERMARETAALSAPMGAAFDGDADRAVFAGPSGKIHDGDDVLLILAERWKREGRLAGNAVVGTVMSNAATEERFRAMGAAFHRAAVGDRNVFDLMRREGAVLGGEPSGHILALEHATTGDGLLTALLVAERVAREGKSLDEMLAGFEKYPQIIVNLRVNAKPPLETLSRVQAAVAEAERALASGGRVLVRYSGTEPKVRLMAEGPDGAKLRALLDTMAQAFREEGLVAE